MEPRQRASSAEIALYVLTALLFLLIAWTWGRTKILGGHGFFWDAQVYARAITTWRSGGDPYSSNALPFLYPPLFLRAATLLSRAFPGHSGWYLYLTLTVLATLSLPWLLATFYIRSPWLTPVLALALFTFQPRFIEQQMFNTGNIALLLYAITLLAGVDGLRHNRWGWFYAAIFFAGAIKPTMLALLLLPLLAGSTPQLWPSLATGGTVFLLYAVQRLSMPQLYAAFQRASYQRLVVEHDIGTGIYSQLARVGQHVSLLRSPGADLLVHLCLAGTLVAGLIAARGQRDHPAVSRLWLPALLVAMILVNPRMSGYDEIVAILPTLFLSVEAVRSAVTTRSGLRAVAIAFAAILFVFTTDYNLGMCLLFVAVIIFTLLTALRQPRGGVRTVSSFEPL